MALRGSRIGAATPSVVLTMITVHRALWLTRFGTLPSRNSLRPAMPALPTTSTSISASSSAAWTMAMAGSSSITTCARPRSPAIRRRRHLELVRGASARVASAAPDSVSAVVDGEHDLEQVELRAVALGQGGRPVDRLGRGGRAVRADHDPPDRAVERGLFLRVHACIFPDAARLPKGFFRRSARVAAPTCIGKGSQSPLVSLGSISPE